MDCIVARSSWLMYPIWKLTFPSRRGRAPAPPAAADSDGIPYLPSREERNAINAAGVICVRWKAKYVKRGTMKSPVDSDDSAWRTSSVIVQVRRESTSSSGSRSRHHIRGWLGTSRWSNLSVTRGGAERSTKVDSNVPNCGV